jgi:hypothetical protein
VGHLNVVGDPLDELVRVLGLHGVDVVLDLLHRDLSSPISGDGQVPPGPRVGSGHQVLGVKELLTELGDGETSVLLRSPGGQRGETGHEEVETRERDHVDGELPQVRVQRSGELRRSTIGNNEPQTTMTRPDADLVLTRKQVVTPDMTSETKWFKSA